MIRIKIEEIGNDAFVTIIENEKLGKSFNNGSSTFFASNGFRIESYGSNVKFSPRLSHLFIPSVDNGINSMSISLGCGLHKTFIDDMSDAIIEYNSQK